MTPLDLMLTAARELYAKGELAAAGMLAARAAPFVHAKFAATEAPAKLHREQVIQDDLFNFPQPTAPLGRGTTVVVPRTEIEANEGTRSVAYVPAAPTLADVASALGTLGLTPRELGSVLQALRAAGALEAEVVVQ